MKKEVIQGYKLKFNANLRVKWFIEAVQFAI
jgi:hypothetical protein